MTFLTEDDIRQSVSYNAFHAGRGYWADGHVQAVSVSDDGRKVEARVNGNARAPYQLSIQLSPRAGWPPTLAGACSCPVGFGNCKHVAAALLATKGDPSRLRAAGPDKAGSGEQTELGPLPFAVSAWLETIATARQEDEEEYPPSVRQQIFYVLRVQSATRGLGRLEIEPTKVRLLKNGNIADTGTPYGSHEPLQSTWPEFVVRPEDRALLPRIRRHSPALPEREGELIDVLRRVIATGRAPLGRRAWASRELRRATPGRAVWRLAEDGSQHPDLETEAGLQPLGVPIGWLRGPRPEAPLARFHSAFRRVCCKRC